MRQVQPEVQEKHRVVPGSRRLQTGCTFALVDFTTQPETGMLVFTVQRRVCGSHNTKGDLHSNTKMCSGFQYLRRTEAFQGEKNTLSKQ